jgi:peptidoglycan hydrolase-like protein with peptidoglycan-binding domain
MKYTQEQNEKLPEEKSGGGNTSSSTASGDGSVSDLQRLLKDKGFDVGASGVDGKFGKATLAAAIKALRSLK